MRRPKAAVNCRERLTSSPRRYMEVVERDEWRRLSRTLVSSAPRPSACGVRVPHPVRARAAQFLRQERVIALNHTSGLHEEPAHDVPQVRALNPRFLIFPKAGEDWRSRVPALP